MLRLALSFCVLLMFACPPRRVTVNLEGAPTTAEECLKLIDAAEAQVSSVQGEGKLFIDAPQGKGAVDLYLAAALPSSLHLTQLDFFGKPQGTLMTDGASFSLLQNGEFLRGRATPQNLARFLPVVLPPSELAQILLGRAPRISHTSATMRFDDTTQRFVLTLEGAGRTQTLHVEPPTYRVVRSETPGQYTVTFSALKEHQGVTVPFKMLLDVPGAKTKLELTLKEVTLNESPDPELFNAEPPDGMPVIDLP